jgi:hypothetical protein
MENLGSFTVVAVALVLSFGLALVLQRFVLAQLVRVLSHADRRRDRSSRP